MDTRVASSASMTFGGFENSLNPSLRAPLKGRAAIQLA